MLGHVVSDVHTALLTKGTPTNATERDKFGKYWFKVSLPKLQPE